MRRDTGPESSARPALFASWCRLICLTVVTAASLNGCSGPSRSLDMMPAPGLYSDAGYDPFPGDAPLPDLPDIPLLYATLRAPAQDGDAEKFYANRRGNLLRVGTAYVRAGSKNFTWEQARKISLAKNRDRSYPLKVDSVDEMGVIASSVFAPAEVRRTEAGSRAAFAKAVNERLQQSHTKDVYVYVHGYKVVFENPVLVASELWHFLGYKGAMIAFSWPATPHRLAYFSDLETAAMSARGLRRLLTILARDTDVERIHLLGYSAGSRVVVESLGQIAMLHSGEDASEIFGQCKLDQVILVGSDIDRQSMGAYIDDGLLNAARHLTVYISRSDQALGLSQRLMGGRNRLGQFWSDESMPAETKAFVDASQRLTLIDVTDAEDFDAGNGHAYFRNSPWVASDVLLTLGHGFGAGERGLVREDGSSIWRFPADYVERLHRLLPRLAPRYLDDPS